MITKLSIIQEKLTYHKELKIKIDKFKKMGYTEIDEEDLIKYLINYRWKNKNRWTTARKKKDILEVQVYEFFDYQRILATTSNETLENCKELKNLI